MQTELPRDVIAFGESARDRFRALGGVPFALEAETDDAARAQAGAALDELGAWDIDARGDADELLAAAQLCRMAGAVVLPYPVVERLVALDGVPLALLDPARPRLDHGDLFDAWVAADLDGTARRATAGRRTGSRLGPFVTGAALGDAVAGVSTDDVARHLLLGAWRITGALDNALSLVAAHVQARRQFSSALSEFQAVRFATADAYVALRGLDELAKYTAWRMVTAAPAARWADAVALRLHAADVAHDVLRCAHQLLGAIGFCDEHDVSVIDRHLQPALRLPYSAEGLADALMPSVFDGSFESLFSPAPSAPQSA